MPVIFYIRVYLHHFLKMLRRIAFVLSPQGNSFTKNRHILPKETLSADNADSVSFFQPAQSCYTGNCITYCPAGSTCT